jgi:signal peptidase I
VKFLPEIRRRLAESSCSGGTLIEQIPVRKNAVLVYGALARLARKGEFEPLSEGPGERIWGVAGSHAPPPRLPGPPQTFRMEDEDLARIEKAVWTLTEGLPGYYFEELRHAAATRADRLAYEGAPVRKAVDRALAELGPPASARRFLAAVAHGRHPPMRLASRRPRNVLLAIALVFALVAAVRWLVVGWYRLPQGQISMAPTLVPGVEGGDEFILANLLAYRFGSPARGDVVVFDAPGQHEPYVKRVLGLPKERVEIREGDVWIDGERLVKDDAFLERVAVPLFGMEGFERSDAGYRQKEAAHTGFRLPDGSVERRTAVAGDVILEGTVRIEDLKDSVTLLARVGPSVRFQIVLNGVGYGAGVFVENRTAARGKPCQLEPGRDYRFWLTNADRLLRFRLDGVEVARDTIRAGPGDLRFEILGLGVSDLRLGRDLVYTLRPGAPDRWTLGENAYFVLGDNSPVSRDSRELGAISGNSLLGRAWRVIWPPHRARRIR